MKEHTPQIRNTSRLIQIRWFSETDTNCLLQGKLENLHGEHSIYLSRIKFIWQAFYLSPAFQILCEKINIFVLISGIFVGYS